MRNLIVPGILVLSLLLIASVNAQDYYTHAGYTSVDYSDNVDYGLSLDADYTCSIQFESTNTFTATSTFDTTGSWYSPDITQRATSPLTGIGNTSCESWGLTGFYPTSKFNSTGYFESRFTYTQSATGGYVNTLARYQCSVDDSDHYARFTVPNTTDARKNCLWRVRTNNGGNDRATWITSLENNYGLCKDTSDWESAGCSSVLENAGGASTLQYIYPFNASGGTVNYSFTNSSLVMTQTPSSNYYIHLLNLDTGETTQMHTTARGGTATAVYDAFSGTQTLSEDTMYLWIITYVATDAIPWEVTEVHLPVLDMEIYVFNPVYVCGSYTECINGTKSRVCVDSLGEASDRIDTTVCELGVIENATIGFEESVDVTVTTCRPHWNVITGVFGLLGLWQCEHVPTNVTSERPKDWTVSGDSIYFNRDFMKFTTEWATEGTRSLKLWTIPMKEHGVYFESPNVVCTNTTNTEFPILERNISNSSMSVGFNVTFPATNMRLSMDVSKCYGQPLQHGELRNAWNATVICPKICYSNTCEGIPNAVFYWNLVNSSGDSFVVENVYHEITSNRKETIEFDLTDAGIVAGENYTLSIAVRSEELWSTDGNCIMIDNVRYDVLSNPFLSILGGVCESKCVGDDYYQARRLSNGKCLVKKLVNYCLDEDQKQRADAKLDFCLDSNTLAHFNELINDHEEITCDNGCSDNHCVTDDEAGIDENIEGVPGIFQGVATGYPEVQGFFTFFFLAILITLIVISVLTILTKHWEVGAIGGLFFIFTFTHPIFGWLPFEVAIVISIGLIILLADKLSGKLGIGRGGG